LWLTTRRSQVQLPTTVPEPSANQQQQLILPYAAGEFGCSTGLRIVQAAELHPTGLALEIPDEVLATVAAAADECVGLFIGNAVVPAVEIRTGKTGCRDPFPVATMAFVL
jgi:hypothetical protein